jgi:branched-chain amino acid transport system permease protein
MMDLNALVAFLNFVFIPATAYGAQLALGALGVTLIYGILRFSNFAHGDTMAFGTMVTILVTWGCRRLGVSLGPLPTALLALPFGIAATARWCWAPTAAVYPLLPQAEGRAGHPGDRVAGRDVRDERHRALHHRGG